MHNQPSPAPAEETNRILLVDDDATNLDVLRGTLEGHGYRLFFARSGEDALNVARRAHPGLILLDVVMPGIDGYETCRRLKDDPDTRDAAVIPPSTCRRRGRPHGERSSSTRTSRRRITRRRIS